MIGSVRYFSTMVRGRTPHKTTGAEKIGNQLFKHFRALVFPFLLHLLIRENCDLLFFVFAPKFLYEKEKIYLN